RRAGGTAARRAARRAAAAADRARGAVDRRRLAGRARTEAGMSFASPAALLALLLVPLALAAHAAARRRATRYAIRFPATETLVAAVGVTPAWRRHLPTALALAALAALA